MSQRNRSKGNSRKRDITLMTLLANESTSDARKLLLKYGKQDASNHEDLEIKLAQLYFDTPDKVSLEKELAEIHPHKKWISKYICPPEESKPKEEKPTEEPKSNADGCNCGCNCGCKCSQGGCRNRCCSMNKSNFDNEFSYFNATEKEKTNNQTRDYVGIIGVVAVVGALFYVLSKNR